MNRQNDALALLSEAITAVTGTPKDVELSVRRYAMACELLGWRQQADTAWLELNGYTAENVVPRRLIQAMQIWVPDRSLGAYERVHAAAAHQLRPGNLPPEQAVSWYLLGPLADLRRVSNGFKIPTDKPKQDYYYDGRTYPFEALIDVPAGAVTAIFDRVERWVFRAAVDATITVRHGSVVENLWNQLRVAVDEPLSALSLTDHLDEIDRGIAAQTPAGRRSALYSCRTLLQQVADNLWLDERATYEPLAGRDGRLDVSKGNTKNRLSAYLHQHLKGSRARGYLDAEIDRLNESLTRLYDLTNDAHVAEVPQVDAEMAVVGTYLLLGELARRTDLKPVHAYEQ